LAVFLLYFSDHCLYPLFQLNKQLFPFPLHPFGLIQIFLHNLLLHIVTLLVQPVDFHGNFLNGLFNFLDNLFDLIKTCLKTAITLFLAHVRPCVLHVGDSAIVDGLNVRLKHVEVHLTVEGLLVEFFGLQTEEDFLAQLEDLFDELRAKLVKLKFFKLLKFCLIDQGTYQSDALPLLEKRRQQSSNAILVFNIIREPLLQC
jgi:hypothetical protein